MKRNYFTLHSFYIIACIFLLTSCAHVKNLVYFENMPKDTELRNVVDDHFELKIRKDDLLGITIISPDPVSTPLFNGIQNTSASLGTTTSGGSSTGNTGYLVDNEGNIVIYKLGTIHVEGLTRNQLKQKLQRELAPYLKDAVITVRFLNNKVTLLGEIVRPQVITMPTEKLSLLDAIGMSGDILITGRKDNVLVIRETPSGKQFKRVNLTDNSIFNSPFYYLKPDDVVYVEPTKYKIKNTGQSQQIVSYVLSGFSILITLLVYIIPKR